MQYFEPNFLGEALVLLDRFGSGAGVLAGGTRIGPALRQGKHCEALINIKRINELREISTTTQRLRIGAATTAAALRVNAQVQAHAPLLATAAASMGAMQLQNLATLGGNVCSGDPASDLSVALLAHNARCEVVTSHDGARVMNIEELLAREPLAAHGELLVAAEIPIAVGSFRCAYQKMTTRRSFEMGLVAVALCCSTLNDRVSEARLAIAGAGPTICRSHAGEAALVGKQLDARSAEAAAQVAAADVRTSDDMRASAAYRRNLVATLTRRAVLAVSSDAHAGGHR